MTNRIAVLTFVIRPSSFLIHIAFVTLLILQFFNVFIGLLDVFAALLLHDFAQRCIDILGHPARIATHEKVGAPGVDPVPNFGRIFRHLVLDVDLLGLIA